MFNGVTHMTELLGCGRIFHLDKIIHGEMHHKYLRTEYIPGDQLGKLLFPNTYSEYNDSGYS